MYVKDGKITKNPKDASWLIAIKLVNGHFERHDYTMNGPLKRVKTFKDSLQNILDGNYYEYSNSGKLQLSGKYKDHKKAGVWYQYNDSGKVVKKESFEIDPAASQNPNEEIKQFYGNQESIYKPAEFKGGNKELRNHIFHNFNADIASPTLKDEQAKIGFTIDSTGSVKNLHIVQSANFAFDQEALRIISIMPKWEPASFNGKPVPSLRVQSITMFDF